MNSSIRDFFQKCKDKQKKDEDIKNNTNVDFLYDYRERIAFYIISKTSIPMILGRWQTECFFELDDEDIEYFKNKYNKKLEQEKESNITEIKNSYKL